MFINIFLILTFIDIIFTLSSFPVLIVISFDAFRHNYFKKQVTPYMEKVRKEGTYADYIENVFPTKTFPNHHTIATGLYPEVHGVVGNSFYDPDLGKIVKMSYEMFHYNDDIEPIWMLNERMSANRHSGVMMWPGGNYKYQNKTPTYIQTWNPEYNFYDRVNKVISWIMDEETPANLVMLYFEEPDVHGHVYGPEANEVLKILKKLDNITYYLDSKLKANNIYDKVNIIQLSDHGMSTVRLTNIINLKNYLTPNSYTFAGTSPTLHIIPKPEFENEIYSNLKIASYANNFRVFKRRELLDRWYFKNNNRTPPIFALADVGYAFQDVLDHIPYYSETYKIKEVTEIGIHGYDNKVPNMHPFFMARGPKIKKNYKITPFKTVDLFNLFCDILEIRPTKNNGTTSNVQSMVIRGRSKILSTIGAIVGGTLLVILLITCAIVVTIVTIKRQQSLTTTAALNKRFQQNSHHSIIESQHLLESEDA